MAARYGDPVSVGVGAVLALWVLAALAIAAGAKRGADRRRQRPGLGVYQAYAQTASTCSIQKVSFSSGDGRGRRSVFLWARS